MISIYDPLSLNRLCNIVSSQSVIWNRKFYDVGTFEIHLSSSNEYQEFIKKGNIIVHGQNAGIILCASKSKSDIKIIGYDLKGICSQRIVVPPFVYSESPTTLEGYDRIKGNAETVMKHYVDSQLVNPTDTDRKIQNLVISSDLKLGINMAWQAKFSLLSQELNKIGLYAGLGYDITFDEATKELIFDVETGIDRTVNQRDVSPVVFCKEYRNISDYEYERNAKDAVNVAYIGGNGEEEQQYITKLGDLRQTGIYRQEGFSEVNSDDVQEVEDGGLAYIKENQESETIETETNSRYKYNEDWFLGDYVTLKIDGFGETLMLNKQITEVQEVCEKGNMKIMPVFGEKKDSIIKRLLRS